MDFEYEHWNQNKIASKLINIRKSRCFRDLPIREKLYLKFYEIFPANYFGSTLIPDNIVDVFEEFNKMTLPDNLEPKYQLFHLCIKLRMLSFNKNLNRAFEEIEKNKIFLQQLESNKQEFEKDKELCFFLGLYYETVVIIFKDVDNNLLEKIHQCKFYWAKLNKEFYYYLPCELEYRFYILRKEYDNYISFSNEMLDYFTKNNFSPVYLFVPFRNLADIYSFSKRLDLKKALYNSDQLFELFESYESIGSEIILEHKIETYSQRGLISDLIGDINASFFHYHEALKLCKLYQKKFLRINRDLAYVYTKLGRVHAELGNLDSALHFQLEALNLRLIETKSPYENTWFDKSINIAHSYYYLIKAYQMSNKKEKVLEYFNKFESLLESENVQINDNMSAEFKISKASILIGNKNFTDLDKAKKLLIEVVNSPIEFELISDSLPAFIDIIVQEYKVFQKTETLDEFNGLSNLITSLLEKNNSIVLRINFLILQGKLALINGESSKAESFYKESLKLAKDFNQLKFVRNINNELNTMKKLSDANLSQNSYKNRIDMLEIENYVKDAFNILKSNDSK